MSASKPNSTNRRNEKHKTRLQERFFSFTNRISDKCLRDSLNGLLNRRMGIHPYRGFESSPRRFPSDVVTIRPFLLPDFSPDNSLWLLPVSAPLSAGLPTVTPENGRRPGSHRHYRADDFFLPSQAWSEPIRQLCRGHLPRDFCSHRLEMPCYTEPERCVTPFILQGTFFKGFMWWKAA